MTRAPAINGHERARDADRPDPGPRCQAAHGQSARRAIRPCSRRPTARVTGAQRLTADLCAQHARMAVDRPQLVREWLLRRAEREDDRLSRPPSNAPASSGEPFGGEADMVLDVAAEMASLVEVRAALSRGLARHGGPNDLHARVVLAVGEAAANAVEHGSRAGGRIRIALRAEPGHVWVEVTDGGRLGASVPLTDPTPPPTTDCRGRGLLLMRRLSEEMRIRAGGDGMAVLLRFSSDPG